MSKKDKKSFKDWGVVKFLKDKAPGLAGNIIDIAGDLTGVDALKKVADKINGSTELSTEQKALAIRILEMETTEQQEITKRWTSDMASDNKLSKSVRPLTMMFLTLFLTVLIFIDSADSIGFKVDSAYIDLLKGLLMLVYFAYFGGRTAEKWKKLSK